LVVSVEHPIYTAPRNPGWTGDAAGGKSWPVDSYLDEGPRSTDWLTKGVIKHHRTLATYVNMLIALGFTLCRVEEWAPSEEHDAQTATVRGNWCRGARAGDSACGRGPEAGRHPQILFDRQSGKHVDPRGGHRLCRAPHDGRLQQSRHLRSACEAEQPAVDRARARDQLG